MLVVRGVNTTFEKKLKSFIADVETHGSSLIETLNFDRRAFAVYDSAAGTVRDAKIDEIKELIAFRAITTVTRDVYTANCCHYDEVTWRGGLGGCLSCKLHYDTVTVRLTHPELDSILDDAKTCAKEAVIATGLAAIVSGGSAAIPTFVGYLYPCLINKGVTWASAIQVDFDSSHHSGNWHCCA